jgi:hypothetical protein
MQRRHVRAQHIGDDGLGGQVRTRGLGAIVDIASNVAAGPTIEALAEPMREVIGGLIVALRSRSPTDAHNSSESGLKAMPRTLRNPPARINRAMFVGIGKVDRGAPAVALGPYVAGRADGNVHPFPILAELQRASKVHSAVY